jgi:hypothetical protein
MVDAMRANREGMLWVWRGSHSDCDDIRDNCGAVHCNGSALFFI